MKFARLRKETNTGDDASFSFDFWNLCCLRSSHMLTIDTCTWVLLPAFLRKAFLCSSWWWKQRHTMYRLRCSALQGKAISHTQAGRHTGRQACTQAHMHANTHTARGSLQKTRRKDSKSQHLQQSSICKAWWLFFAWAHNTVPVCTRPTQEQAMQAQSRKGSVKSHPCVLHAPPLTEDSYPHFKAFRWPWGPARS